MKMESYPKPPEPFSVNPMQPSQTPVEVFNNPFPGSHKIISQTKRAVLSLRELQFPSSPSNFCLFFSSVAFSPAYLEDLTPGSPHKASTTSPESSASVTVFVNSEIDFAFNVAFSTKPILPSSISGKFSKSSNVSHSTSGKLVKKHFISLIFPLFFVAITIFTFYSGSKSFSDNQLFH